MKKRDLLLSGLILFSASVFAQEPPRYSDDAQRIFFQDFEGNAKWQTIRLNQDENRPTTLFTWDSIPVDTIKELVYYKKKGDGDVTVGNPKEFYTSNDYQIAGVRKDSIILMYDGVVRTDAPQPDDEVLSHDSHDIVKHDDDSQHGTSIGGKAYGLDRYGEDGGDQYFTYKSATSKNVANRSDGDGGYVPEYRRNLFVRNIPIEENSSYRVTVFVKPTTYSKGETKPRIGVDLMRGYFHSEKSFIQSLTKQKVKKSSPWGSYDADEFVTFSDKTDYTDLDNGKWNKITLMAYYANDSVGNASPYLLGYYWDEDWHWSVKTDKDGNVAEEGDSTVLKYIQQPAKYFVRLSFRSDSTQFDVDNLSLTKSWIGGVEYLGSMLRVDFGYKTNLGKLAEAAKEENKIAAVKIPGENFVVWALWPAMPEFGYDTEFWEQVPISSAEYQGDGYMYMWTQPWEDGEPRSFDGAKEVLVSFTNPEDEKLRLVYEGSYYPNGMDSAWIAKGKPVMDFHNEIAALNPTIDKHPDGSPVRSLEDLPPVLQKEQYENGTFGLDVNTRQFTFKFSKNLSYDSKEALSAKTKIILRGNGKDEYWTVKPYEEGQTDGWTTVIRPDKYEGELSGDYVLLFRQVTHLDNPDQSNLEDYGDNYEYNYHFGDFDVAPVSRFVLNSDWRNDIEDKTASNKRPIPTSVYIHNGKDAFQKGKGVESGNKCGFYNGPRDSITVLGVKIPDDGMFYLSNRTSGVTGNLYSIVTLNKGNYIISFKLGGHSTTDIPMQLKFYAKPTGTLDDGNDKGFKTFEDVANKTVLESGKKPAVNQGGSYSTSTHWKDGIETVSYAFSASNDGEYVFEWVVEGASDYPGICISNYWITTGGDLSMSPVTKINEAIASAEAKLLAAAADKYQGADYNNVVAVKRVADGFIAAKKATNINLPSEYAAEAKEVNDAVKALQLHMDTVDAFDKSYAAVVAKIEKYATNDTLMPFEGLAVVTALKGVKDTYAVYPYSDKKPGEIAADTKVLDNAVKAVDDRQAINNQFLGAIADAEKSLAATGASKYAAQYQNLTEAIADAKAFDAVNATDDELKGQMNELNEIKLALDIKVLAAGVVSTRIKALGALATKYNVTFDADITSRIQTIDEDDDALADVMKAAIKVALYNKIANGDSIGQVDLTPFIKNYHLYATVKGIEDRAPENAVADKIYLPGKHNDYFSQPVPDGYVQKATHQYDNNKKIWILVLNQEYKNSIFPGWTVKSVIVGDDKHCIVSPDNTGDFPNLSKGVPVFDGALYMDWNSKAQLSTEVEDLPVGIYALGATLVNGRKDNSNTTATLTVTTSDTTISKKETPTDAVTIKYAFDSLAVADGNVSINFEATTQNGGANLDNFTLTFLAKDASYNYQLAAQSAQQELDNLITVVDEFETEEAKYEYFTLGGVQVSVLEKGQAYIQKITIGDEIITKTVFVE